MRRLDIPRALSAGSLALLTMFIPQSVYAAAPCAHRGDVKSFPENTIPALAFAACRGAAMIEFDVQMTKDCHLVIMHDATVDRTTDGTGAVSDLTLDEIRALDAGSWFGEDFGGTRVPLLEEALQAIPESVWCNVHIKSGPGLGAAVARVLESLDRLDHCFLAASEEQINEARAAVPRIKTCNMSRQGGDRRAYVEKTLELKAEFIQLHQGQGTDGLAEYVQKLHENGVMVNWYGANDEALMRTLAGAGVDYILTDDLGLCLRVLGEIERAPKSEGR